ncbi:MAG: ADP-ribose pyrophosphatase [Firmicutes bacterium HGW-Firmicutes-11]|jgi:ADP-ribose pyrophosphatase|nr:MAG: ADP-ribose pyrophosphatase [Firmicutes bacterium HGW-Firmicutes-11]
MTHEEITLETERIYEGKILNLRRDKVLAVGEQVAYREIVEHKGGVAIAAITDDGKMVMVRQYRKAASKVVLEVPAGKIESDEDHKVTASRELQEETGYTADHMEHLTSFYSSIGYSEEFLYLYLATGLTRGPTNFDDNEAIDILEYDLKELKRMVMNKEIEDAKTIAAIFIATEKLGA